MSRPGATLLMLEFEPRRLLRPVGGVTLEALRSALPAWQVDSVEPATTEGMGWPLNRMRPTWYRLHRL